MTKMRTNSDRLRVIEKLETSSKSLQTAADSMREELVADSSDIEKVNEAIHGMDWGWYPAVALQAAGYATQEFCTQWQRIPAIERMLAPIFQLTNPAEFIRSFNKASSTRLKLQVGQSPEQPILGCLKFVDLDDVKLAIYNGTIKADGLLKTLQVFTESKEAEQEKFARWIQESQEGSEKLELQQADIERQALGAAPKTDEPYHLAFEQKWGDLSAYNGTRIGAGVTPSPEFKAKMLRKQAAYSRLQADGLDVVTERTNGHPIPDNRKLLLEGCDRMEKEAAEIELKLTLKKEKEALQDEAGT